jgi:hypothetical protein
MANRITPTMIRALLAVSRGESLRGAEWPAWRRCQELALGSWERGGMIVTLPGWDLLAAYRIGRRRWGAHA